MRFGIAASMAIMWIEQWRRGGRAKPRPITAHLDQADRLEVFHGSVWRLFDRARKQAAADLLRRRWAWSEL